MLTTVLLLTLFTADPAVADAASVPANFKAYFERAEASRTAAIKLAEERIEEQEIEYRGAAPARKGPLRKKINLDKSQLETNRARKALADLPNKPVPGDLGHLTEVDVLAVLDDKTLVAKILAQPMGKGNLSTHALLRLDSTKGIRTTDKHGYHPADIWLVLDENMSDDESAMKWIPTSAKKKPESLLVLKAVPSAELEKHRANWLASQK